MEAALRVLPGVPITCPFCEAQFVSAESLEPELETAEVLPGTVGLRQPKVVVNHLEAC